MNLRLTHRSLAGVVKILQLTCRMLRCLKNDWFWPAGASECTVWGLTHPLKKAIGRGRPRSCLEGAISKEPMGRLIVAFALA
jgi:hypothetical protein